MTTKEPVNETALATLDADAQEALKAMMEKAVKKTSRFKLYPSIAAQHGIKKPKFEVEGQDDQDSIEAIIVQYETMREYRETKDDLAPTCSSVGGGYGTAFGKCSECQYGKWEEGEDGKRRKECKDNVKLILVAKGLPGRYEMKVAPTSMKNWSDYEKMLTNDEHLPVGAVVTKLGLSVQAVTGKKPWSVLTFNMEHAVTAEKDKEFIGAAMKAIVECRDLFKHTTSNDVTGKVAKAANNTPTTIEDAEVVSGEESGVYESVDSGDIPF